MEEPKPGANHVICAVCREQFKDYYEHIFSPRHKRGVLSNQSIFGQIDELIAEVDEHQLQKGLKKAVVALKAAPEVINPEEAGKKALAVDFFGHSIHVTPVTQIEDATLGSKEEGEQSNPGSSKAKASFSNVYIDLEEGNTATFKRDRAQA